MNRSRPAYIERKRELERARAERRRSHAQPCDCWACITPERSAELIAANLARNTASLEEINF